MKADHLSGLDGEHQGCAGLRRWSIQEMAGAFLIAVSLVTIWNFCSPEIRIDRGKVSGYR